MTIKICLHERTDGKIDYYQRYSNQALKENKHLDSYVYQGWFLNQEHAETHMNCWIKNDKRDFIHFDQDTIKVQGQELICKSWIFLEKENPADPSDFEDVDRVHLISFSGSLAKFLEPGPHIINSSDSVEIILQKFLK
jgi:hypothetical protein